LEKNGESAYGLKRPTCALQQVGRYLRISSRQLRSSATVENDPKRSAASVRAEDFIPDVASVKISQSCVPCYGDGDFNSAVFHSGHHDWDTEPPVCIDP
jgi:hypothetical protein